jgi:flagellar basal-body rod protein FlgC
MADPTINATLGIAASALQAQQSRMRVIAENLANADSVSTTAGGDPYQRQIPVFAPEQIEKGATGVRMTGVIQHDPGNPAANANGDVKLPNVDSLTEALDMKEAQRAYEASLNVITAVRSMQMKTLSILTKGS